MADQGESKPQSQGGLSSMMEINEALTQVTSSIPSTQAYTSTVPQYQHQQSPHTIPYQQPHLGGQSPPTYAAGPDHQPYHSYSLGQYQLDPSSAGYQYRG